MSAGKRRRGGRRRVFGAARPGRDGDPRIGLSGPPRRRSLSDHAQGTRGIVPSRPPAPVAPFQKTARAPADSRRGPVLVPRVPAGTGVRERRHADLHPERLRGDNHALRDPVLRSPGLSEPERPALQRGRGHVGGAHLLSGAYFPGRKVEDPPASHRVLDAGAGGRLRGTAGHHRPCRGVDLPRGLPGAREPRGGTRDPGARPGAPAPDPGAVPPGYLRRGSRDPGPQGDRLHAGRRLRGAGRDGAHRGSGPAALRHPLSRRHQGVLHGARSEASRPGPLPRHHRSRGLRRGGGRRPAHP